MQKNAPTCLRTPPYTFFLAQKVIKACKDEFAEKSEHNSLEILISPSPHKGLLWLIFSRKIDEGVNYGHTRQNNFSKPFVFSQGATNQRLFMCGDLVCLHTQLPAVPGSVDQYTTGLLICVSLICMKTFTALQFFDTYGALVHKFKGEKLRLCQL